jgi:hypothetical protein
MMCAWTVESRIFQGEEPMHRLPGTFGLVLLAICTLSTPAFAYLDPGSGSMLLQGLLAAVAAGGAYIGMSWRKLKDMFRPGSSDGDKPKS